MNQRTFFAMLIALVAARSGGPETTRPQVPLIMKSLTNDFFATMAEGAYICAEKSPG